MNRLPMNSHNFTGIGKILIEGWTKFKIIILVLGVNLSLSYLCSLSSLYFFTSTTKVNKTLVVRKCKEWGAVHLKISILTWQYSLSYCTGCDNEIVPPPSKIFTHQKWLKMTFHVITNFEGGQFYCRILYIDTTKQCL